MSLLDATIASYLNSSLLPILLILLGLGLFVRHRTSIRQRIFAFLCTKLVKGYNKDMEKIKEELFEGLRDFKSLDRDLRNEGGIRILEIGVGPGFNFKYYPQNSRITVVDPNPFFRKIFEENKNQFPNIKLEKAIVGGGENMTDVKSESVDVVITTLVMCSVENVKAVLKEVKRVLVPGGQYLFLEHVLGDEGTNYHRLQRILGPIWPYIFDGCEITRNLGEMIEQAGFSKVNVKKFTAPLKSIFRYIIGPHIMGNVQK